MDKFAVCASDIDGTLCFKGEDLMPVTREALIRLHEEGVLFGPASGRPVDSRILHKAQEWKLGFDFDFAIGMNGGELYDRETGKIEKYHLLPKEKVREILTFLQPYDINAIVYVDGYEEIRALRMDDFMKESVARNKSHVTIGGIDVMSEFDTGKIEVQFHDEERDAILEVIQNNPDPAWNVVQTFRAYGHCTFEFQDPRVNKGLALTKYAEKHMIPMEKVLAFGDQENDIGLLKEAGTGVCLLNGADASKAVSQFVTEYSVGEDGVGRWLFDHYFEKD